MDGVSFALALAGTLIALGGLYYTWKEKTAREREIDLLRRQVEAVERQTEIQEQQHAATQSADVRVKRGGREGLGWSFDLVNGGSGAATNIRAWLERTDTGQMVSSKLEYGPPLMPGEVTGESRALVIPLAREVIEQRMPLRLMLQFSDRTEPDKVRADAWPIDL